MNNVDTYKKQAAIKSLDYVKSGMILGLGSGSTVFFMLRELGKRIREGELKSIVGIPSSKQTERFAQEFGIHLSNMDKYPQIDLTIDGADEVDRDLNLIKGGGGALLREKILAQSSERFLVAVDETKLVNELGKKSPIPVEVVPFGYLASKKYLETIGHQVTIRTNKNGAVFKTDQGNFILDFHASGNLDYYELSSILKYRAGIVEHGLFLGMADEVIIAGKKGVTCLKK